MRQLIPTNSFPLACVESTGHETRLFARVSSPSSPLASLRLLFHVKVMQLLLFSIFSSSRTLSASKRRHQTRWSVPFPPDKLCPPSPTTHVWFRQRAVSYQKRRPKMARTPPPPLPPLPPLLLLLQGGPKWRTYAVTNWSSHELIAR